MVLSAVLIDSGEALKVVTALLERLLAEKGPSAAKEAWTATGLSLLDFAPKCERDDQGKLQQILDKHGLQSLYPKEGIQNFLPAALEEGKSAADIVKWIREHAGDAADAPEFAEFLAMQLFDNMLGLNPDPSQPVFNADSDFVPLLLAFVASENKREVALIWGAQNVYKDWNYPKGLLRRMLMDLHQLRIVSEQALETWRYCTNDTEAIKDVQSWLEELKQSHDVTKEDPKASNEGLNVATALLERLLADEEARSAVENWMARQLSLLNIIPQGTQRHALSCPESSAEAEQAAPPNAPAILPAGSVRSECASETGRESQSQGSSNDWSMVD